MKKNIAVFCIIIISSSIIFSGAHCKDLSPAEYIDQAKKLASEGRLDEAVSLLEKGIGKHPDNSDLYAYLGIYKGSKAGKAEDPTESLNLVNEAFSYLDKAVSCDGRNPIAYLYRGILETKVPSFFGKLEVGITDLKKAIELLKNGERENKGKLLASAYRTLAEAYEKSGDTLHEREALSAAVSLTEDSTLASKLRERLNELPAAVPDDSSIFNPEASDDEEISTLKKKLKENPSNMDLLLRLARSYYDKELFEKARETLKIYTSINPGDANAYYTLAVSTSRIAEKGYDENTAKDTNYRASLAFEAMSYADRAVELEPENYNYRLLRGIFGISFPFFIGRLEQGMDDLKMVTSSDAPDSTKAVALYYLGVAEQKQAMKFWREAIEKAPESEIARLAFETMRPETKQLDPSKLKKPVVAVDFVIGYKDELPPQTSVWIEDEEGNYIKTLYVSGFSGYAKEKQVNLPVWSAVSKFEGIDAVTGASIDVGHHLFYWNLMDKDRRKVKRGTYIVKVECSFWPSMKYQMAEAKIKIGKKKDRVVVEEGNLIPFLEVSYFPR